MKKKVILSNVCDEIGFAEIAKCGTNSFELLFRTCNPCVSFTELSCAIFAHGCLVAFNSKTFPQTTQKESRYVMVVTCCKPCPSSALTFELSAKVWDQEKWLHHLIHSVETAEKFEVIVTPVSPSTCLPTYIQAQVSGSSLECYSPLVGTKVAAWCLDDQHDIVANVPYFGKAVSTYDFARMKCLLRFPQHLPYCNWLVNQPFLGMNVPGLEERGVPIQVVDIQGAIWTILDNFFMPVPAPLPYQPENVMFLVQQCLLYGANWVPTLPTQQMLVALDFYPTNPCPLGIIQVQVIAIPVLLLQLGRVCPQFQQGVASVSCSKHSWFWDRCLSWCA